MASPEKRCLYEVLGLSRDCTADEIRSAYRKLALQRHPDKLIQSGVSEAEATASFQELVNAYEVLSDPRERAWYDSHRSQILFSSSAPSSSSSDSSSSTVPNLFSFFSNSVFSGYSNSGMGFFKVYGDVFDKIYQNELNFARKLGLGLPKEAPLMGNLEGPYAQVTAFYNYWLGFVTVMDFCWVDQYDVMAGPNRKSRRVMEEENKKLRKKARREYNDTVRGLAEFVKKRDKRVIDMQLKRNEEMERKREEERQRKKELERAKAEQARTYEEPDWAKIDEQEEMENGFEDDFEEDEKKKGELYCVVCGKKFKSEKQWKNHEQSKKHKERLLELREAFSKEDRELQESGEEEEVEDVEALGLDADRTGILSADDIVDHLQEQFEGNFEVRDDDDAQSSEEQQGLVDGENYSDLHGAVESGQGADDDASFLEAMLSGHKSRRNFGRKVGGLKIQDNASLTVNNMEVDKDDMDFMEYNSLKASRRNRGSRRERSRKADEPEDVTGNNSQSEENIIRDDVLHAEECTSTSFENETNEKVDDRLPKSHKASRQTADKKASNKNDSKNKSKNAGKGRKQKATSRSSANACDACGEEFESRNKLHKHLGDTGHAMLKHR